MVRKSESDWEEEMHHIGEERMHQIGKKKCISLGKRNASVRE
jgi:hypothetical protein